MAEARDEDDEIFVYIGGDQEVPEGVRRVRIHKSIKIIPRGAFYSRRNLIYVEFHDEIEIIEEVAFAECRSLRGPIRLLGIKIIKMEAFSHCKGLTGVEFGDMLETIEKYAFYDCISLRSMTLPSVRTVRENAFNCCDELSDVEFGEDLETLEARAFGYCQKLKRLVLPLKENMIEDNVFGNCPKLERVDLVGGIHNTVASLHMVSWRNDMVGEICGINQVLPNIESWRKTEIIQRWIVSVIRQLNHYKAAPC